MSTRRQAIGALLACAEPAMVSRTPAAGADRLMEDLRKRFPKTEFTVGA